MTEYTDVPRANQLHAESQQISQALANLEAGGTLSSMVISPPPYTPPEPGATPTAPTGPVMQMPINVIVPPPVDATLLADVTQWLETRLTDITAELESLGVTVPPAGAAQWTAQMPGTFVPTPPAPPPLIERNNA